MTKVKVTLKKEYQDGSILKHIIILNQTNASFKDVYGNPTHGKVIGVSVVDNETHLFLTDTNNGKYNRKLGEV